MLRIAGLPVWVGPSDVVAGARTLMGWTAGAVEVVTSLPERASALLDDVEALVARIAVVADRVEGIVDRADVMVGAVDEVLVSVRTAVAGVQTVLTDADHLVRRVDPLLVAVRTTAGGAAELVTRASGVADGAGVVIDKATAVAERAGAVVEQASGAAGGATELLGVYRPIAQQAAPLARRFVTEFSEEEVLAAIRLVDQLPQLTEHMENDIMPILATLDRVGPDVHELLEQLKEMRQAIQGIPGLGFFRRRGEREDAQENGGNGR